MKYVNITQTPDNAFSHKGSVSAWDNAGKDSGIDGAFAPFDAEIVWLDTGSDKTGVLIQNTTQVKCPDGKIREPYTIKVLYWHDNYTKDLQLHQLLKQGQVFYQEGTAGHATGNHVHFNVGIGKFDGKYPLVKNSSGVWEIKGEIDPTKIFFVDDSNIVISTKGMKWVKYSEEVAVEEVKKPIVVNSVVRITGSIYATGQKIPLSVKSKTYRVIQVSRESQKALLGSIYSWVYIKDLESV